MIKSFLTLLLLSFMGGLASAQVQQSGKKNSDPSDVLNKQQWERIDKSVERALAWLAKDQNKDGSFTTYRTGQPGVTALCLMAFMAQGEKVGEGKYGDVLQRAVDYIVAQQKPNGLISRLGTGDNSLARRVPARLGVTVTYNHALSALALAEVYGQSAKAQSKETKAAIERAIAATLEMQGWQNKTPVKGGWRYVHRTEAFQADLSVTGWQLMFLRSARGTGFDVPAEHIEQAVGYIESCFDTEHGTFTYLASSDEHFTRGMAGAGILALAHAGKHDSKMATQAGDWILKHGFEKYNGSPRHHPKQNHGDRYHYGLLTCCQAMYQIGGRHWRAFYPPTVKAIVENQLADGSWPAESDLTDNKFGTRYTTALCVLSLSAPNQLLPIFQR